MIFWFQLRQLNWNARNWNCAKGQVTFIQKNSFSLLPPKNLKANFLCISIQKQINYLENFRIPFKMKEFWTNNNYPLSEYQNSDNKTEVTSSSSKSIAIYSILTFNLTGDFLWRYNQLWPRELTVKVSRSHTVGRTPLYKWSVRCTDRYLHNRRITMPSGGFEPASPGIKRQHNYSLDRPVTGNRRL